MREVATSEVYLFVAANVENSFQNVEESGSSEQSFKSSHEFCLRLCTCTAQIFLGNDRLQVYLQKAAWQK